MKSYEATKNEVDQIVDGLGKHVDEKIKKLVIALRMMGVQTESSCEGHREWGHPYPWVMVYALEQGQYGGTEANMIERKKVIPLVDEFNARHAPKFPLILEDQGMYGAFRIQSFRRNQEVDADRLEEYQKIMNDFANFVIHENSLSS